MTGFMGRAGGASRASAILAVPLFVAVSCGGITTAIDDSPRGVCERGGGTWESDGCNGAVDVCGSQVWELAIGPGCHCREPGECWDGKTIAAPLKRHRASWLPHDFMRPDGASA